MELEPRRVLSADFALGADGLVIHGFDAETDGLTITQAGDEYLFTLSAGDWDGASAAGVSVDGATLAVSEAALAPLAEGVLVVGTPGLQLGVTFGDADFSSLAGPVQIVGATSLGQTAGSLVTAPATALAVVAPDGLVLDDMNLAGDFAIEFAGSITDAPGTTIFIDGDATFTSRAGGTPLGDLNMDGLVNSDDIALWTGGFGTNDATADVNNDATVSSGDYAILRSVAGTAGSGGIQLADSALDSLTVVGKATFVAQSEDASARFHILVGTDGAGSSGGAVEFGSVSAFGGKTVIVEDNGSMTPNGTVLDDSDVTSLELLSAGAITDTGNTEVVVAELANFSANAGAADITLDDIYDFGSLQFNGAVVTVVEQSGTVLVGDSFATTSLDLDSAGPITDDGANSLTVTGNADFNSTTGKAITLDDLTYAFGSLTVNGGDVTVVESDGTQIVGTNLVTSLDFDSGGAITDSAGDDGATVLAVLGNADLNAVNDDAITLDDTHNFGSLTFDGGDVTIDEASDTVLSGTSNAAMLDLDSLGSIIDDGSADVTVTGNADFNAVNDDAITLDDTYRFGTLTFDAGDVRIIEADGTDFFGVSNANTLDLDSGGDITNLQDLFVAGNADFNLLGGTVINLIGINTFGSVTFNGTRVFINEADATILSGASSANTLDITSVGSITDDGTADVDVAFDASFTTSNGDAITLDDTYDFGTLTFDGGAVTIVEDSSTALAGESDATTLNLSSNGAITDEPGSDLDVVGNAKLTSITGDAITLDEMVNFGSLTFMAGAVMVAEDSATVLSATSFADSLDLDSAGSITDDGTADVTVISNASFDALNDDAITLDDTYNFGTLTFDGGVVDITEASGTELTGDSVADELTLTSLGSITDTEDATLFVTSGLGTAVFSADGSIVLADAGALNQIAIVDATFNAGIVGPEDDILVGVVPATGDPADAMLLINLLTFNAPGSVQFGIDGNVALPASAATTDDAFAAVGEDDLSLDLDPFGDEELAA